MVALSVSISTSSSPRRTCSPSAFSQRRMVPSSMESESLGMTTSATGPSLQPAARGSAVARGRVQPPAQQRRDLLRRLRAREVEALGIPTADAMQLLHLGLGLHALG